MNIVERNIAGDCLLGIGIPDKGIAIVDKDIKPEPMDVVWCDNEYGTVNGFIKQIVKVGNPSVVQTRYEDTSLDFSFETTHISELS